MSNKLKFDQIKFVSSSKLYDLDTESQLEYKKMIEQTAVVVGVEAGYAWVLPNKAANSCGGCSSKASCAPMVLDWKKMKDSPKMRVLNPLYARPGDSVVVGMQGDALVLYSLLAYLLPLVSLIVFAVLGQELFALSNSPREAGAILGGVAGLVAGLKIANVVASYSTRHADFHPVILRVNNEQAFVAMSTV